MHLLCVTVKSRNGNLTLLAPQRGFATREGGGGERRELSVRPLSRVSDCLLGGLCHAGTSSCTTALSGLDVAPALPFALPPAARLLMAVHLLATSLFGGVPKKNCIRKVTLTFTILVATWTGADARAPFFWLIAPFKKVSLRVLRLWPWAPSQQAFRALVPSSSCGSVRRC